ncbi:hypothetical protein J7I93_23475 [Bacillus sp. ISL-47]|uniref:hypothetical protein n=1 Tax=Bacillus sp. ISL-47 TaxID=2819130 RepID=UPI001BE7866F|nr:hypothetical protein [Bacillus sp. ISL-47]MBT2691098.1 hypothetical protein [Bacillus sp. ISL-47]MBT2707535.1 hypothetical protein [Pseudomonas sp. ISL-84]
MLSGRCYDDQENNSILPFGDNVNGTDSGDEAEAFTFAAQANLPQTSFNGQLPISVGGFAVNAALINIPILSAQYNIANGGDSTAIAVNGTTQQQSNKA